MLSVEEYLTKHAERSSSSRKIHNSLNENANILFVFELACLCKGEHGEH